MNAIEIAGLNFDYNEKKNVLKDINLSINSGESVGIIGPNGAGKTTIFHLLCGLLKPLSGDIYILGKRVEPGAFNRDIGYLFQNPDDQLFSTTVFDDVAFGPANLGLKAEEVFSRTAEALEITGCTGFSSRPPHHLSGGEKRMAAIATIIAMSPQIMIYDEPSSNLDMRSRRRLINFIRSSDKTKLVSSHDLEFILETCGRTVILDEGMIVSNGKAHEVMNNEKFMLEHGLEKPHSLLHKEYNHEHK